MSALNEPESNAFDTASLQERWLRSLGLESESLDLSLAQAVALGATDFAVEWFHSGAPARCGMRNEKSNANQSMGTVPSLQARSTMDRWLKLDGRMLGMDPTIDWTKSFLGGMLSVQWGGYRVNARAQLMPTQEGFLLVLRLLSRFDPSQALAMVERLELQNENRHEKTDQILSSPLRL